MKESNKAKFSDTLKAVVDALSALASVELRAEMAVFPPVGWAAFETMAAGDRWCETHLAEDAEAHAGIVISDALARIISAKMMMLTETPATMNEDMEAALDEAWNIAIGAWNKAMPTETWHWGNRIEGRSTRRTDPDAELESLKTRPVAIVAATIHHDGVAHDAFITGDPSWMPDDCLVVVPALPEEAAAAEARAASADATAVDDEAAAAARAQRSLIVVDETGSLVQWLNQQLTNPAFSFHRSSEDAGHSTGGHPVVMIGVERLEDAARARQFLVIKRR